MQTLHATIEIEAPATRVWEIIDDLPRYPEWNPFIVRAVGERRVGAKLDVSIRAPGMSAVSFHPRILNYEPGRLIRWKGVLWIPGLFDGRHALLVEPLGDGRSRFTTHEDVTGILLPVLGKAMRASQKGFEEMSRALKKRAES